MPDYSLLGTVGILWQILMEPKRATEDLCRRYFSMRGWSILETDLRVLCFIECNKKRMSRCARLNILSKTTVAGWFFFLLIPPFGIQTTDEFTLNGFNKISFITEWHACQFFVVEGLQPILYCFRVFDKFNRFQIKQICRILLFFLPKGKFADYFLFGINIPHVLFKRSP